MIGRLALVSGIAVLCAVISDKALAQSANVDFTGSIPPAVTINATSTGTWNGTSGLDFSSPNLIRIPATLTLSSAAGLTFTINSITDNGTSLSGGKTYSNFDLVGAEIKDGNNLIIQAETSPSANYSIVHPLGIASPVQTGPISNKDYQVYLTVGNNVNILPTGTYNIRVKITLTPQ